MARPIVGRPHKTSRRSKELRLAPEENISDSIYISKSPESENYKTLISQFIWQLCEKNLFHDIGSDSSAAYRMERTAYDRRMEPLDAMPPEVYSRLHIDVSCMMASCLVAKLWRFYKIYHFV